MTPPAKPKSDKTQKWNAANYNQNSSIQFEASKKILSQISFKGTEHILDLGCGDGKITAMISSYIPNGEILGIDLSSEMIDFAKTHFSLPSHKNISFLLQDGNKIQFENEFDMVFSSFALHWIIDFDSFMKKIHKALQPNGKIVFTIPIGISSPLEQATEELMKSPSWAKFFDNYVDLWRFSDRATYEKMLSRAGFNLDSLKVITHQKTFDSRASFEGYVIQWYPYLNYIGKDHKEKFFNELIDRYLELEPPSSTGAINFEFPRVDIIAHKK